MKRRRDVALGVDDDGLQADVMRFMAIIAFCLVAIMALARNAAPLGSNPAAFEVPSAGVQTAASDDVVLSVGAVTVSDPEMEPSPEPNPEPNPEPSLEPSLEPNRIAEVRRNVGAESSHRPGEPSLESPALEPAPMGAPISATPATEEASALKPALDVARAASPQTRREGIVAALEGMARHDAERSPPSGQSRATPEPVAKPTPAPDAAAADNSLLASAPQEASGLSLRFASERDFLRLIGRDAIEVFAFREGDVLALTSSLRFAPSAVPGEVYELLPSTIPSQISALLANLRTESEQFQWGVRMPGRIERAVRAQVDAGAAGVLVIDRFGEVRLLAHREP
ncbi:MAG: hypothetical protein MK142_01290 [Pseudomonadales bacterium]|nr:hypothetical protein [Pseudomonadales bacterium]